LPKNEHEAFISATSAHVLAFDNVSGIRGWQSDLMCRISTGGGYVTRQLYTTGEERIFETQRPQVINGITDVIERPDLAERTLPITLERISAAGRKTEAELLGHAAEVRPR